MQLPWMWPLESTKVRLEHWQPMLVKGEAAFSTAWEFTMATTMEERMMERMLILLWILLGRE